MRINVLAEPEMTSTDARIIIQKFGGKMLGNQPLTHQAVFEINIDDMQEINKQCSTFVIRMRDGLWEDWCRQ